MRHIFIFQFVMLLFWSVSAEGQINLSSMDVESSDSLQKSSIRYFAPGFGGMNKVWDFSSRLSSKNTTQVMFRKSKSGIVSVTEDSRINYYRINPDTLYLLGTESPTEWRGYTRRKLSKVFPLEYGDSTSRRFKCTGAYCGNHPFREIGTTTVNADALGAIVFAENDTLRNVTRVHIVDTYSVCMDMSYAALDTAKQTQIIEDKYEWFLPDAQYPIIEDVTSTTYINMTAIGTKRYAYCNLPEDKTQEYITIVDEYPDNDDDVGFDEANTENDIIHYKLSTNGTTVYLTYDLDNDANVYTIVSSHMGMTYKIKEWTQKAGQGYSAKIDCSGLRHGTYILYINVNGKVFSEKITL